MERDFIRWLTPKAPQTSSVVLGPGDDAAILRSFGADEFVITTDMLMDQVDFRLSEHAPIRIGRKSLAVNLSDLAAMAADPVAAVVAVALPKSHARKLAEELTQGVLELAHEFNVALIGGDTNTWNGPLVISITAIGRSRPEKAWPRSGAKPGDLVLVTGSIGGSILGKHFDFTPRIREAMAIRDRYQVSAAMDVSDGLSIDLSRLAEASHVGIALEMNAIPISDAAYELAKTSGKSPLEHALGDGEDFELILTASPEQATRIVEEFGKSMPIRAIGEVVAGCSLWKRGTGGLEPAPVIGFEHGEGE